MVVDTSAIVAVMIGEPIADKLGPKILASNSIISAPILLEALMVLSRHLGPSADSILSSRISELGIVVVPCTEELAWEAGKAFARFGKGRHPAALNYGDCMSYALAKMTGSPLLFTGEDFSKTDITLATLD